MKESKAGPTTGHTEPVKPDMEDIVGIEFPEGYMEEYLLPFPAKTTSLTDNAKVSLLLEKVLRYVFVEHPNRSRSRSRGESGSGRGMEWISTLSKAVEVGIAAREEKSRRDARRRKGGKIDGTAAAGGGVEGPGELGMDEAGRWLRGSGERLRVIISSLK
ncbi:MAG: hypothetical protein M1823_005055 [Watsoniomyces obsoletus]|nr:MAG: hypothetical protein M1823_005055 [Watsoniomyces obsoletus]